MSSNLAVDEIPWCYHSNETSLVPFISVLGFYEGIFREFFSLGTIMDKGLRLDISVA